jgi:hypothetical protein
MNSSQEMDADHVAFEYGFPTIRAFGRSVEHLETADKVDPVIEHATHSLHATKESYIAQQAPHFLQAPSILRVENRKDHKEKKKKKKRSKDKKKEKPPIRPDQVEHRNLGRNTPHQISHGFNNSHYYSSKNPEREGLGESFATLATEITTATTGSASNVASPIAPFALVDIGKHQQSTFTESTEAQNTAEYHSDMLRAFLRQNGQDDKVAKATAMAFENFLKSDPMLVTGSPSAATGLQQEVDDKEENRIEKFEHMIDHSAFSGDQCWDDESFFHQLQRQRAEQGSKTNKEKPPSRERERPNSQLKSYSHHSKREATLMLEQQVLTEQDEDAQRTVDQLAVLPSVHRACVRTLKRNWEEAHRLPFSDEWYIRFAKCSPGKIITPWLGPIFFFSVSNVLCFDSTCRRTVHFQ